MPLYLWPGILGPLDGAYTSDSTFSSCGFMSVISSSHSSVRLYCIDHISVQFSASRSRLDRFPIFSSAASVVPCPRLGGSSGRDIVGEGSVSPLKSTLWLDVMLHTAERLKWVDGEFEMIVFSDNFVKSEDEIVKHVSNELDRADILVVVAVRKEGSVNWIQSNNQNVPNIICFDSSLALRNKLGGSFVETKKRGDIFSSSLSFSQSKKLDESVEITRTVFDAWERHNSDDIRFCLLVIINAYITPVSTLKNLRAKGFSTLNCMVTNCGSQILNCLLDPNCRKALQCLNNCSPVDHKNNCLELDAKIPEKPYVTPMAEFRGEKLSTEIAKDLFVGWLGTLEWSWRVVAGQNPAYDQFPCQYQLFYRGKARGSFWYEPVFQVKTLEGDLVWRRRKYRVKRGKATGTFHFSVLDNGVVSNEFWTIVDVSDDLSWGLFHYHGVARVAGQSYTGVVLVSPDGQYPVEKEKQRLISALDRCGIKACENAPLGIPDGSSLHSKIQVNEQTHSSV
ncbi:hypothetical protein KY285_020761 [Solanum tuberosum]|nr:hypothetical protein KY285_020761 [Solanum tuberosum]